MGRSTRISDHAVTRVRLKGFKATWNIAGTLVPSDHIMWQYHTGAYNLDTKKGYVSQRSPASQQFSPHDTRSSGSDDEPNDCINPGSYWPYKRVIVQNVNHDMWISYNNDPGWVGEHDPKFFEFKVPIEPTVTLQRNGLDLVWTIDPKQSSMDDKSQYNRVRTRYYVQQIFESKASNKNVVSFPVIGNYARDMAVGTWFGTSAASGSFTVSRALVGTLGPQDATAIRLIAINDGFTGESNHNEGSPSIVNRISASHVFSRPNQPAILSTSTDALRAYVNLNSRANAWHPVDEFILQRLVASEFTNTDSDWNNVDRLPDPTSISVVRTILDGYGARLPVTDKATWYRVVSWHDAESNRSISGSLASTYTAKPAKPTINSVTWQTSTNSMLMSVSKNTNMRARTYLRVVNMSTEDGSPVVENEYELTGELTNFYVANKDGGTTWDAACVYRLYVYNRLYNVSGSWQYGNITTSEEAETTVRGSAEAYAKAVLATPTITDLRIQPSGTGVSVSWEWENERISSEVVYKEIGTFVEWTDAEGGWLSTKSPSSYKKPDQKDSPNTVIIDGLTEGKLYNIRVRRYITIDGEDAYGGAALTSATPWSTPDQPELTAPGFVRAGEDIRYTWTFSDSGDSPQVAAVLTINGDPIRIDGADGAYVLHVPEDTDVEDYTARVMVNCGGGWSAQSESVVTTVAQQPTCTLALTGDVEDETVGHSCYGGKYLRSLPLGVELGGNGDVWRVTVRSVGGALSPEPSGGRQLADNGVAVTTLMAASGEIDGSMILGGGNYNVEAVCIDQVTGLESDPVVVGFMASWRHEAVPPTASVSVVGDVGYIIPMATDGIDTETDRCRIWRDTADGPVLACDDAAWGEVYVDNVPTYSEEGAAYVIETVTADGGHAWSEVPYDYAKNTVIISYGNEKVELPWNLTPKDTYKKDFERRSHMDGTRSGYWGPGIDRDWTCGSSTEKGDTEVVRAVRELARYDGLCYVRAPFAVAFPANVTANVSSSHSSAYTTVDMTCEVVDDDGTFAIAHEVEEYDPDGGEG